MNHPQPYPPPLSPIPEDPLLGNPCDPCDPRRPMNPLAGIWAPHRTTLGYREASPYGDGVLFVLEWTCSARSQQTANYSLHTANSTVATPISPAHPILHSTFYILHWIYTFSAKERDPETGLSYFGSRYYSSDLSIWLSVDPMASKYPSWSPYMYCANNPVKLVDPNGDTISLLGDDWESALAHMQKHCPNLEISRGENGCLSYSYKKGVKFNQKGAAIVSDEETMFCKVIDSKEVKVSLTANYKNVYTAKNGKQYKSNVGGGFLGSTYNGNKTADAEQFVSMILLNKYYASEDIGRLLLHEATEADWGGERAIELQRNTCVPQSNIFGQYEECGDYNYAHNKAISQPTTRFEKFMSRTSYDLLLYHLGKGH